MKTYWLLIDITAFLLALVLLGFRYCIFEQSRLEMEERRFQREETYFMWQCTDRNERKAREAREEASRLEKKKLKMEKMQCAE